MSLQLKIVWKRRNKRWGETKHEIMRRKARSFYTFFVIAQHHARYPKCLLIAKPFILDWAGKDMIKIKGREFYDKITFI